MTCETAIIYDGQCNDVEFSMQRVTITLDDNLMADLDRIIAVRGYQNRSEAIRDLARSGLNRQPSRWQARAIVLPRWCMSTTTMLASCPKRLTQEFHDHHDLSQATMHVHLDAQNCLEMTVLKGRGAEVQAFANQVIAERGVRHGHVVFVPIGDSKKKHHRDHSHRHNHSP